eukprot:TRINITY_DN63951_c0_g1_i1.p1 TRINITY_DN63951_c0_g1~~TRINITY_DN63951_c0_g1_i1.p1  ORF type:complete len:417 (-),score=29.85 TRINITY_DN63951_c0_g1_i1:120-1295(-)
MAPMFALIQDDANVSVPRGKVVPCALRGGKILVKARNPGGGDNISHSTGQRQNKSVKVQQIADPHAKFTDLNSLGDLLAEVLRILDFYPDSNDDRRMSSLASLGCSVFISTIKGVDPYCASLLTIKNRGNGQGFPLNKVATAMVMRGQLYGNAIIVKYNSPPAKVANEKTHEYHPLNETSMKSLQSKFAFLDWSAMFASPSVSNRGSLQTAAPARKPPTRGWAVPTPSSEKKMDDVKPSLHGVGDKHPLSPSTTSTVGLGMSSVEVDSESDFNEGTENIPTQDTPPPPPPRVRSQREVAEKTQERVKDHELGVNDHVIAWFYGEWHPATVRRLEPEQDHVEVLWDAEWSVSLLPRAHVALVQRAVQIPLESCRPEPPSTPCPPPPPPPVPA